MKTKPIEIPEDDFIAMSTYRLSLIRRLEMETCAPLREILLDCLRSISLALNKPVPTFKFDQLDLNTTKKRLAVVLHAAYEAVQRGVFPYTGVVEKDSLLIVQPSALLNFGLNQRALRIKGGAVAFNRHSFRAALMVSGFVVGECDRIISGRRFGHLLIIDITKMESFYREHGPGFN